MSFTDRVVIVTSLVVALALGASAVAMANGSRAPAKVATESTTPTSAATQSPNVTGIENDDSSDRESSEGTAVPEMDQETESGADD